MLRRLATTAGALAAVLLLDACLLRPTADRTRFFTLAPMAEGEGPHGSLRLGLGPVDLPGYLDRAAIVTRLNPEQVRYAPSDRWASPLHGQLTRTLAHDLSVLLGTDHVRIFPWYPTPLDAVVTVHVSAFEADVTGMAHLAATWAVKDGATGRVRRSEASEIAEPVTGQGTDAQVAALSRALGELARRIADAVPR